MGQKITTNQARSNQRRDITGTILKVLAVTGFIAVALVAPNALRLFVPTGRGRRGRPSPWEIERAFNRLLAGGYIKRKWSRGKEVVAITDRGHQRLHAATLRQQTIAVPKRWDGRWRLVFFDIPHVERVAREMLRRKLKELGFLPVQKSVYLHPYECYDVIKNLRNFYHIDRYLQYAVVERLEHEQHYRHHFKLTTPS